MSYTPWGNSIVRNVTLQGRLRGEARPTNRFEDGCAENASQGRSTGYPVVDAWPAHARCIACRDLLKTPPPAQKRLAVLHWASTALLLTEKNTIASRFFCTRKRIKTTSASSPGTSKPTVQHSVVQLLLSTSNEDSNKLLDLWGNAASCPRRQNIFFKQHPF